MYTYGDVTRISKKVISFHDQNHVHESAHEKSRLPGIGEKGPKLCWRHSETELFVTLVKGRTAGLRQESRFDGTFICNYHEQA